MKNQGLSGKIWHFVCFSILFYSWAVSAAAVCAKESAPPENLYAISACLMDADTGRVLFEKNGDEERAMASTTKIMTLIVTLESADLTDTVTISEYAARQPDVQLNVNSGETYQLKDLLYSLMLESHNDAAVAIAEHVGGSVEGFAALMNQKAKDLGLMHTYFITPNGLDASNENGVHHTTAVELAKIMSYCITQSPEREAFLEITRTPSYSFSNLEGGRSFTCNNHNAFLQMMTGALSGKTGFTADAGYCYVGALEDDGRRFVVALLGCGWPNNKSYKWSDTKRLMQYGMDCYEKKNVYRPVSLPTLTVMGGVRGDAWESGEDWETDPKISLRMEGEPKELLYLLKTGEDAAVETKLKTKLTAPVKEGDAAGEILYRLDGEIIAVYPVVCGETTPEYQLGWCVKKVFSLFLPKAS